MSTPPTPSFGELLRQHRLAAGLTQEELAERAGLSADAISTLERGARRAPHPETIRRLADALALSPAERTSFEAAARQRVSPSISHLPIDPSEHQALLSEITPPLEDGPSRHRGLVPLKARGRLIVGLVSGLLVVVVLAGTLFFKGEQGVSVSAGQQHHILCLATDFPATGEGAVDLPQSMEHAVQLAVMQNEDLGSGYTLKVRTYHTPTADKDPTAQEQGRSNITSMVENPCILGVFGPLSSKVAAAEMPLAATAGLAMISPINTSPGLTLREYAGLFGYDFDQLHPAGKPLSYFRVAPNEIFQGIVAADFTLSSRIDGLGARSAYVLTDGSHFGDAMAGVFTQEFLGNGGTILGTDALPLGGVDRTGELVARIVAARPQAIFYGGATGVGQLKGQLAQAGYSGAFVGTDGVHSDTAYLGQAGLAANGTYATDLAPELKALTSDTAAAFVRDFYAHYPGQYLDGYGAYTYDAALIFITAIKHLIQAGQQVSRAAVIEQVQHIQYTGVTGPISFDINGDNAHAILSLYTVQENAWRFVEHLRV